MIEKFKVESFKIDSSMDHPLDSKLFPWLKTLDVTPTTIVCPDCTNNLQPSKIHPIPCDCGFLWSLSEDEQIVTVEGKEE